ncbi:MAG: PEP-CTERM sorting domain-containing protein [Tepidisphaeraceae bacterium]|jgi:hypothetical protein
MNRKIIPVIAAVTFASASLAMGQVYTCSVLYPLTVPTGFEMSASANAFEFDAAAGGVAGHVINLVTGYGDAVLWSGPTGTALVLNPGGFTPTNAVAVDDGQVVGGGDGHALLWSNPSATPTDLNPNGFISSVAGAIGDGQEVGSGNIAVAGFPPTGPEHALLWYGTAASAVDLGTGPSGFASAVAVGVDGSQQVGYGGGNATGGSEHALLWSGTAVSVVDLNPSGFWGSTANGVADGQQVGSGQKTLGSTTDALLWYGSASSYIDLNPNGFVNSQAHGIGDGYQVGWGVNTLTSSSDALVWSGSADSCIDLGTLLPPGEFLFSTADSVDPSGNIYGLAEEPGGNLYAVEWSPVPEPATTSLLVIAGTVVLMQRRRG